MEIRTKAIVLHSLKYTENSVIVHAFTEEHGRMAYLINGAKSKKSALRSALLLPLSIIEIETDFNPKKDIQRIKESRVVFPFVSVPFDPSKNALVLFIAELLYRTIKETQTDKALFKFLVDSIMLLDEASYSVGNFHLVFMVRLSSYLGFEPHREGYSDGFFFDLQNGTFIKHQGFSECLDIQDSQLFGVLLQLMEQNIDEVQFSKNEKSRLLSALLSYYKSHISNFAKIKSLEIMQQLFS